MNFWKRLARNKIALLCLFVLCFYVLIALLSRLGMIASPWNQVVGPEYAAPSLSGGPKLWLGTDIFGRSVLYKVIHGAQIALTVGFVAACVAVPIGVILGSIAGYFGGWIDEVIVWIYSVLSSVPSIMLLIALTYVLGKGFAAVVAALTVTSWIGTARIFRGEFIKHKNREYVLAAQSIGASRFSRIFKHILPNLSHFAILNFSMQFMSAIKAEVILSFLGIGIQGEASWGTMIDDAKLELSRGAWWQLAAATLALYGIVLVLNIFGDMLRDLLDPKWQD